MTESLALEKRKQSKFTQKVKKVKEEAESSHAPAEDAEQDKSKPERGLVYIGHIPHGFYENEMRAFFSQFGTVSSLRVCRSKATGRSKGYAFVEFANIEVAKIAAESMDNYLMYNRRLITKYFPISRTTRGIFKGAAWSKTKCPGVITRREAILKKNKNVDDATHLKKCRKMVVKVNNSLRKLHELGINYKFNAVDVPSDFTTKVVQPTISSSNTSGEAKVNLKNKRKAKSKKA